MVRESVESVRSKRKRAKRKAKDMDRWPAAMDTEQNKYHEHQVLRQILPPERPDCDCTQTTKTQSTLSHIQIPARWTELHSQNAVQRHVLSVKYYAIFVFFLCYLCCRVVLGGTTVLPLYGTTVEPRYFFFTVPVPSRSRYYRDTAIPRIPRYYRTVLANE